MTTLEIQLVVVVPVFISHKPAERSEILKESRDLA
jgi:hypothetical protein